MLTRRDFFAKALGGVAVGAALFNDKGWAAGRLAWPGPIGLEIYTVRDHFAKDPAGTLKRVAAIGYKEVENSPGLAPHVLKRDLRAAGLALPSIYFEVPKSLDDWKKTIDEARDYGVRYMVVGDNPRMSAAEWKLRAEFFNQCGRLALSAGMQFCYHAHYHEFATVDGTCGYDIMLARCEPKFLKMEMDIFWVTYAGKDPLAYWKRYPGRFPLLHIKDFKPGFPTSTASFPYDKTHNPFAPVGQGRIDWPKLFAHVRQAGAKHIFVEQDMCDQPTYEAAKISYDYLRKLRLS